LRSILDLACGTGTLTMRLAEIAPEVIGLDASESMLIQARARCSTLSGVQFRRGDFCSFQLGRQFDAVVCAFNSLNYLTDIGELVAVFRSVALHLRPGGLFVFDSFTRKGMLSLSGLYLHTEVNGRRFAMRFDYDPRLRKERALVLLPAGIETHWRIPI